MAGSGTWVYHIRFPCYDFRMGKSGSKNFVNQFKNTKRQAQVEQRKRVQGLPRKLKRFMPAAAKWNKTSEHGDK